MVPEDFSSFIAPEDFSSAPDFIDPPACPTVPFSLPVESLCMAPDFSSFIAPEDFSSAPDFIDPPACPTVPFSLLVAPPCSDGCAFCCICWVPPDSLVPVPCAFARPVPATSASAATEIIRRLVIELSSRVFLRHCPRRQRQD